MEFIQKQVGAGSHILKKRWKQKPTNVGTSLETDLDSAHQAYHHNLSIESRVTSRSMSMPSRLVFSLGRPAKGFPKITSSTKRTAKPKKQMSFKSYLKETVTSDEYIEHKYQ